MDSEDEFTTFTEVCKTVFLSDIYGFKKAIKTAFQIKYPKFAEDSAHLKEDSEIEKFKQNFWEAQKILDFENIPDPEQVLAFYQKLLSNMIPKMGSQVHFKTNRSVCEERNFKPVEFPKIIIIVVPPRIKDNDEEDGIGGDISLFGLMKYMAPYVYLGPAKKNFIGVVLKLSGAVIIWVRNFTPGEPLSPEHVDMFFLNWSFEALKGLSLDIQSGKGVAEKRVHYIEQLYLFLDFLRRVDCM